MNSCPRTFKADKLAKKILKEAIAESEEIESVKVDKRFVHSCTKLEVTQMSSTSKSMAKRWIREGEQAVSLYPENRWFRYWCSS